MASQIYSRYIPPKKNNAPIPQNLVQIAASHAPETPKPTPPPTRNDASSTYARYVPVSKKKAVSATIVEASTSSPLPPSTKRKAETGDVPEGANAEKRAKKTAKAVPEVSAVLDAESTIAKDGKREKKEQRRKKKPSLEVEDGNIEKIAAFPGLQPHVQAGDATLQKKEKKRKSKSSEPQDIVKDTPETPPDATSTKQKKSKKKRSEDDAGSEEETDDIRHKKLMKKREKSLKKAEKLGEDVPEDTEPLPEPEVYDLVPLPQPEPVPEPPDLPTSASLPPWLASPIRVPPTATAHFEDLGIAEDVAKTLRKKGYQEAFAVQAAVIPLLQEPGDIVVAASTGSGKTLSYILPMIEDLSRMPSRGIRGLIVMPTRELVTQAQQVSEICASAFPRRIKVGTAVGNETIEAERFRLMGQEVVVDPVGYQERLALKSRWTSTDTEDRMFIHEDTTLRDDVLKPVMKVDILICTPGRLVEHIKTTPGFDLTNLKWLVVDEADKLLDQSFQQWLSVVMAQIGKVRKIILSATMTKDVGQLNQLKLVRPRMVVLKGTGYVLPSLLAEAGIKVEDENLKPLYLMELLKRESMEAVLIFTKSNEAAVRLGRLLSLMSLSVGVLTSTTPRATRQKTIASFSGGVLVASDLVSRGLDISLAHVINYDMPTSVESYVHRIGRAARAGKKGNAWTFFTATEGRWFWNDLARAESITRSSPVDRVTLRVASNEGYVEALQKLEKEVKAK